ncbi:hypothetical protein KUCAC02_001639, partial [Chaenocephalus aceratus]
KESFCDADFLQTSASSHVLLWKTNDMPFKRGVPASPKEQAGGILALSGAVMHSMVAPCEVRWHHDTQRERLFSLLPSPLQ